jgi:Kef-type K+ transport system membrane component KefB/nucleotide-binding universal stress UspA family protein
MSTYPLLIAAAAGDGEHKVTLFFVQVALLVAVGRLLGEGMQRVRQPAVLGQLLAGIMLGPSVFGALWPSLQQVIFPLHSSDREMLNAVSELGILMLLLLTGMETDLALVKRVRSTAAVISIAGIVIPFACGYGLGELLPESILPDPHRRFFTSLFLAVALSISSVKIVAAVLREVDFLRRNLGQVNLAAAIIDDIIGWTILAFIGGLAAHGKVQLWPLLLSIGGTIVFLIVCFTIGHRWVARLIRWANDHFLIEMPVISVILVLMIVLALLTNLIGVHTVLGAFVAGIMIGQSPILTKHIEEQLRGLIVALFMPVFFGVAGLSIDLKVLGNPEVLGLAGLVIAIATVGKLGGCYIGSRIARLRNAEAFAIGVGMNARGSTEIILATIGLTMGVLNQRLFTIIVVMAVVTTLCMPPLLRWALGRVPMREEEKLRLETQAAEEKDLMPKIERVLVGLDTSQNAEVAGRLSGWLVGARHLTATVVDVAAGVEAADAPAGPAQAVIDEAETASRAGENGDATRAEAKKTNPADPAKAAAQQAPIRDLVSWVKPKPRADAAADDAVTQAIIDEAANGYGLLFLGLAAAAKGDARAFPVGIETLVEEFPGPVAILVHGGTRTELPGGRLERILVPTTGADYSRFGAEVAVGIAKGCGATITAFHVAAPTADTELMRRPEKLLRPARALLGDLVALGQREGVRVLTSTMVAAAKERAILRQAQRGRHQLIVLGTKAWAGDPLHFGQSAQAIIEHPPCPVLIVRADPMGSRREA